MIPLGINRGVIGVGMVLVLVVCLHFVGASIVYRDPYTVRVALRHWWWNNCRGGNGKIAGYLPALPGVDTELGEVRVRGLRG